MASARQNLPTLIGMAAREPQEVYRRDTLVARVVGPDVATEKRSFADALAELQQICAEEHYELPVAPRRDRPNPFAQPPRDRGRKKGRKAK